MTTTTAPTDDWLDRFVEYIVARAVERLDTDETWTVSQVADYLGVDQRTVRKALEAGTLPGARIGNRWRCSRLAIQNFTSGRTTAS